VLSNPWPLRRFGTHSLKYIFSQSMVESSNLT
jgi:hypothetical protein